MRPLLALSPLLLLALSACDGGTSTLCPGPLPNELRASVAIDGSGGPRRLSTVGPTAVRVTVVDSVSGRNLAQEATGTFVTGTVAGSLLRQPPVLTAHGPAGRYTLVVNHPGYATWGTDAVRVRAGDCGPETEEVTARLRPEEVP